MVLKGCLCPRRDGERMLGPLFTKEGSPYALGKSFVKLATRQTPYIVARHLTFQRFSSDLTYDKVGETLSSSSVRFVKLLHQFVM